MSASETVKRFTVMLLGMIITALGLAVCVRADLGISPITTLPYALSQVFPALSLGTFTFLQHILFFVLMVLLLRRDFQLFQLLQIPCSLVFGYFVDFWEIWTRRITLHGYVSHLLLLLLGCIFVAFGFSLVYTSRVALEANTAFLNALSLRTGKRYSTLKTLTDVIIVIAAAITALIFLHQIVGIREGTIISALLIGPVAGIFNKRLSGLEKFF